MNNIDIKSTLNFVAQDVDNNSESNVYTSTQEFNLGGGCIYRSDTGIHIPSLCGQHA